MIKNTKKAIFCFFVSLALLAPLAYGQDIPAVTTSPKLEGFSLPGADMQSTLTFAITGSQSLRTGYNSSGNIWASTISGDAAYQSRSLVQPFSAVYSGGYIYTSGNNGEPSSVFQNLSLSQTLQNRFFNATISNAVRYLPEAAIGGLSGLPGLGDIGVTVPTPVPDSQDILSNFAARVTNTSSLSLQRPLTGKTSIQGSGDYIIQRFVSGTRGLDSNQLVGSGGLNRRIDALNSANLTYSYSSFEYPSESFSFVTQGLTIGYKRQMSRRLSLDGSGGPQLVTNSTGGTNNSSLNFSIDAGAAYESEYSEANLRYIRGVRSGSGVVQGSLNDGIFFNLNRKLSLISSVSLRANYSRNTSIAVLTPTSFSSSTISAGFQYTRAIGQYLSGYGSYTALSQNLSGSLSTSTGFRGLQQIFSVGITYSPRPIHLGH